jgi:hypothetical protein
MLEVNENPEEVIPLLNTSQVGDRILGLVIGGGWWGLYLGALSVPRLLNPSGRPSQEMVFGMVLVWVLQIILLQRFRALQRGILLGTMVVLALGSAASLSWPVIRRMACWIWQSEFPIPWL